MIKLTWFQKWFTREVIGEITVVEYSHRQDEPITLYTITQEDGQNFGAYLQDHLPCPYLKDQVHMYLSKTGESIRRCQQYKEEHPDGSLELICEEKVWESVRKFSILSKIE